MACFQILEGPAKGLTFPVADGDLIGSAAGCQVRLPRPDREAIVAARIRSDGFDFWIEAVRELPLLVNDAPGRRHRLSEGATLAIPALDARLVFRLGLAEELEPTTERLPAMSSGTAGANGRSEAQRTHHLEARPPTTAVQRGNSPRSRPGPIDGETGDRLEEPRAPFPTTVNARSTTGTAPILPDTLEEPAPPLTARSTSPSPPVPTAPPPPARAPGPAPVAPPPPPMHRARGPWLGPALIGAFTAAVVVALLSGAPPLLSGAPPLLSGLVARSSPEKAGEAPSSQTTLALEVLHPGYQPFTESLTLSAGERASRSIQLEPATLPLEVRSQPPGQPVTLNGTTVEGRTPVTLRVPADSRLELTVGTGLEAVSLELPALAAEGSRSLLVRLPGNGSSRSLNPAAGPSSSRPKPRQAPSDAPPPRTPAPLTVRREAPSPAPVTSLVAAAATVAAEISSDIPRLPIFLDGRSLGTLPFSGRLPAGPHLFRVRDVLRDQWIEFRYTIPEDSLRMRIDLGRETLAVNNRIHPLREMK